MMRKPKLYYEFSYNGKVIKLRAGMDQRILQTGDMRFARRLLAAMEDAGLFVNGESLLDKAAIES